MTYEHILVQAKLVRHLCLGCLKIQMFFSELECVKWTESLCNCLFGLIISDSGLISEISDINCFELGQLANIWQPHRELSLVAAQFY